MPDYTKIIYMETLDNLKKSDYKKLRRYVNNIFAAYYYVITNVFFNEMNNFINSWTKNKLQCMDEYISTYDIHTNYI